MDDPSCFREEAIREECKKKKKTNFSRFSFVRRWPRKVVTLGVPLRPRLTRIRKRRRKIKYRGGPPRNFRRRSWNSIRSSRSREEKAFIHLAIIEVKNHLASMLRSIFRDTIFIEWYIFIQREIFDRNDGRFTFVSLSFLSSYTIFVTFNVGCDKYRTESSLASIISHNRITQNG